MAHELSMDDMELDISMTNVFALGARKWFQAKLVEVFDIVVTQAM
jgi:hypothetical protein